MKKKASIVYLLIIASLLALSFRFKPHESVARKVCREMADTSSFVPNAAGGCGILSSYLNRENSDSVEFELIIKKNSSTVWSAEQFIGTITNNAFLPKRNQTMVYNLFMGNSWIVRITTTGECYIRQLGGQALKPSSLPGGPFVLPVKVKYKNS